MIAVKAWVDVIGENLQLGSLVRVRLTSGPWYAIPSSKVCCAHRNGASWVNGKACRCVWIIRLSSLSSIPHWQGHVCESVEIPLGHTSEEVKEEDRNFRASHELECCLPLINTGPRVLRSDAYTLTCSSYCSQMLVLRFMYTEI